MSPRVRAAGPWVAVAAVLAVVVCAVGWPMATGWAVGGTGGAVALYRGVRGLIRGPKNRTTPAEQQVNCAGCTPACANTSGIRGLLEHVGIDTTGRDITVGEAVVDAWTPNPDTAPERTDQP